MNRLLIVKMGVVFFAFLAGTALAQRNPRGTTKLDINGKTVSVEYGRPSLKGRSVSERLNELKPGVVWRLGADKSTTFSAGTNLAFGNVTVPKGEYSLWARRESDNSWALVFNKQHGQWGTDHDPGQDLVSVPLKESKASGSDEMVTIALAKEGDAGGVITIQWGDMKLSADFQAQ
jgi:DUF2911 family protein